MPGTIYTQINEGWRGVLSVDLIRLPQHLVTMFICIVNKIKDTHYSHKTI